MDGTVNVGSQEELLKNEAPTNQEDMDYDTGGEEEVGGLGGIEKKFLLLVERGDVASIKRLLEQYKEQPEEFAIDCTDPLGRSAMIMAIENENYELIQLLLEEGAKVKDSLLHAIKEEYVEAVELLLEWEEQHHEPGTPYSWEAADRDTATFTPDITPLVLAAHKDNYEILKILLDRGATLPSPHDVKCGCDGCISSSQEDSLTHSRSRINAYRALSSPSLICLSSKDPFLTAFELSVELKRLSQLEAEFRSEYSELRNQCQEFSTALLGHARTSLELQILLNNKATKMRDLEEGGWEPGEKQSLDRLKLAIKYKQKKFVAHSSVQQLLAAMWYEGLPGFRRKHMVNQIMDVGKLGAMFPMYSFQYMMFPDTEHGKFVKKPFVKFICHASSYLFFLGLLAAQSQRIEYIVLDLLNMHHILEEWQKKERGALPGPIECLIIIYIIGYIWAEIKSLWNEGVLDYIQDLWNMVDFINNTIYVAWIGLRATAYYVVLRESWRGQDPFYKRETWDTFDPTLLAEGMFGAGMIFSFLKLVHIFSINPHLGPLQVSLGRMVVDIIKFFFIFTLVMFAFGCGLNQLLWYYADLERNQCIEALTEGQDPGDSCFIWRRFANLFETSQSLFWAGFGLVELDAFELTGIKGFTRFWGLLMFGSYSVINIIVLLNMLIAMMSNSYQIISERSDVEWKFARSKLWISYFDEGATVPVPFNIVPTLKSIKKLCGCGRKIQRLASMKKRGLIQRYMHTLRMLVRRYVSAEETKKQEEAGITEDDVNEIRQDISSFRFELIDILKTNGMRTPNLTPGAANISGRKGKVMERRLMKDFQIGVIENAMKEAMEDDEGGSKDIFSKLAKAISGKKEKKDWNALVRKTSVRQDHIGSKQNSLRRKASRRRKVEEANAALFSMDPSKLAEYNPKLEEFSAATRLAYAKFKTKVLITQAEADSPCSTSPNTPKIMSRSSSRKSVRLVDGDIGESQSRPGRASSKRPMTPIDEGNVQPNVSDNKSEKKSSVKQKREKKSVKIVKMEENAVKKDFVAVQIEENAATQAKGEANQPEPVVPDNKAADLTPSKNEAKQGSQVTSVPNKEEPKVTSENTEQIVEKPAKANKNKGDSGSEETPKEATEQSSKHLTVVAQERRPSTSGAGKSAVTGQTRSGWL